MRRALRNSILAALILIPTAALPAPSRKEIVTKEQAEQAERQRAAELAAQQQAAARAAAATAQADALTEQRIEAAANLRNAEATTEAAAMRMDALIRERREAAAKLAARAKAMQPLLPLIERLSLFPAETMLAVPTPPDQTVRAVMVLHGIARQLQQDAEALRTEQARLDAATKAEQAEAPELAAAEAAQQRQEAALDQQIIAAQSDRQQAEAEADAAAARAAAQAGKAATLRVMLSELETRRRLSIHPRRDLARSGTLDSLGLRTHGFGRTD